MKRASAWIGVMTDDGVKAPGFRCLVTELAAVGWHVEPVGPKRNWSSNGTAAATGPSKSPAKPLRLAIGGVRVEVVDLPPAAVARLICSRASGQHFDAKARVCIVSGVNHGPNVGANLIHSGTFGGAMVASWLGFSAVAVSLDDVFSVNEADPGPLRFREAARIARFAVEWVVSCRRTMLCNINVPNSVRPEAVRIDACTPHALACDRTSLGRDTNLLKRGRVAVTVFPGGSLRASEVLSRRAAVAIAKRWQNDSWELP